MGEGISWPAAAGVQAAAPLEYGTAFAADARKFRVPDGLIAGAASADSSALDAGCCPGLVEHRRELELLLAQCRALSEVTLESCAAAPHAQKGPNVRRHCSQRSHFPH